MAHWRDHGTLERSRHTGEITDRRQTYLCLVRKVGQLSQPVSKYSLDLAIAVGSGSIHVHGFLFQQQKTATQTDTSLVTSTHLPSY